MYTNSLPILTQNPWHGTDKNTITGLTGWLAEAQELCIIQNFELYTLPVDTIHKYLIFLPCSDIDLFFWLNKFNKFNKFISI